MTEEYSSEAQTLESFNYRERLPALDGLRGVAILAVFFYHYAGGLAAKASSGPIHALGMVFAFGWSGVDLFFVLSGFLITGILYDTQKDPRYYRNFYSRRALRIFPPFYLLALVFILLTPVLGIHWKFAHLAFLFYLGFPLALIWPSVMHISPLVITNHLWSLCAEEQFYAIWPAMVTRLRSRSAILWACAAVAVLALSFRIAVCVSGWLDIGWTHDFLLSRMDTLALGAAIAILVRGPQPEKLLRWAAPVFFVGCAGTIALCAIRHSASHLDPLIATVGFSLIALMYGGLLLLALRPGAWVARILSLKGLRICGRYSYGMYLYDLPLTLLLSPRRDLLISWLHSYALGSAVFLGLCLLLNLLLAAASFHFIEAPIMRLKSRFPYSSS